ncbi:hypothetical protein QTH91_14950 [Variovorax dokdonensis]|uniref:T3SS negative regulator,GrlR n=1 Tax=Variovorax dokdonensis TaxID=344883 RepID=A0ABT7NCV6_9BURK|nr:hypothetical protein [Variovorax dokdonensis]MDM0045784.1 hypothetical protein [Variovorax dokdonensis]
MKNGIYEATFTTNVGTLGKAAVIINRNAFVGVDGLQFYRGEIDRNGDDVSVIMEVTRHNFVTESALGSEPFFTLTWRGRTQGDSTFRLSCEPPGSDLRIYVSGTLLKELEA